jgi:hypothetical protein
MNDEIWGKNPGPSRTRVFSQSSQAIGEEPLSLHGNDFTASVQSGGDSVVAHAFGGVKDHHGSPDLNIRQRIFCGSAAQLGFLSRRNGDFVRA